MEILDIVLTNIVSYMGGILTGLFISYKIKHNKEKDNNIKDNIKDNRELDYVDNNINNTPIPSAPAYPVTPPPVSLNPEYVNPNQKPVTKLVFSTE